MPPSPAVAHATDRPVFEPAASAGGSKTVALAGLLLVAAAALAWFFWSQKSPIASPASAPSATLPAESVQPEVTPQAPTTSEPAATMQEAPATSSAPPPMMSEPASPVAAPPAVERAAPADANAAANAQSARLNQERLERERRERLMAAQEQARAAQELERQRAAEQARRQANTPPTPSAKAAAIGAPTVASICDGSGNFLAREVCRVRECFKPSFASDPICVNFRKMEEANRAREQAN